MTNAVKHFICGCLAHTGLCCRLQCHVRPCGAVQFTCVASWCSVLFRHDIIDKQGNVSGWRKLQSSTHINSPIVARHRVVTSVTTCHPSYCRDHQLRTTKGDPYCNEPQQTPTLCLRCGSNYQWRATTSSAAILCELQKIEFFTILVIFR